MVDPVSASLFRESCRQASPRREWLADSRLETRCSPRARSSGKALIGHPLRNPPKRSEGTNSLRKEREAFFPDYSSAANPGIGEAVSDVGQPVGADYEEDEEQREELRSRIVTPQHRVDEQIADPGPAEDRLDDEGVADDPAEAKAGQRDHGNERVSQDVAAEDAPLGKPFRAERPHEVLAELLEHRGAHHAE